MLSLKDKLLKAGVVTAEQVKKVEDEESAKKQREAERRERARLARDGRGKKDHGDERRDRRRDEADEKVAAREHQVEEAQRWRQRLAQLKSAGKSEQYDAIRGWVTRHRIDQKTAMPSEQATRFHFAKGDGAIGHLTLEPEVHEQLRSGAAGVVAFMGFNGLEHAVVPADLAKDIHSVRPEWVSSLLGVTDQEPAAPESLAETTAASEAAAAPAAPAALEGEASAPAPPTPAPDDGTSVA